MKYPSIASDGSRPACAINRPDHGETPVSDSGFADRFTNIEPRVSTAVPSMAVCTRTKTGTSELASSTTWWRAPRSV